MTDGVLSSKEFAGAIITLLKHTLLKHTLLVADERELSTSAATQAVRGRGFGQCGRGRDGPRCSRLVGRTGGGQTRALARRSRFGVLRDP